MANQRIETTKTWTRRCLFTGAGLAVMLMAATLFAAPSDERAETTRTRSDARPQVVISHHKFSPAIVNVPVGTTVTWVNRDDEPHTVTSTMQLFTSPGLDSGEVYRQTFTKPGTYVYFCTLHPLMTAQVVVK